MYSKITSVALLLASTGVGAAYTKAVVPVPTGTGVASTGVGATYNEHVVQHIPTGTGVASPPYSTGRPSTPGNHPLPEEPLQVTVDNCITFRNAGIAVTCSDTPDSLRPGNATTNGYMRRRKRTTYGGPRLGHGPVVPSPPLGGKGKRPLCYKFILGYHDRNGRPVAPQQFPCYADDSRNPSPSPPHPGLPVPPVGTGTPPFPTFTIPKNSTTPPESTDTPAKPTPPGPSGNPAAPPQVTDTPAKPTPTGDSENAEVPPEKSDVPETPASPPGTPAPPAPTGPTGGYQAAAPPQPPQPSVQA